MSIVWYVPREVSSELLDLSPSTPRQDVWVRLVRKRCARHVLRQNVEKMRATRFDTKRRKEVVTFLRHEKGGTMGQLLLLYTNTPARAPAPFLSA